MGESRKIIVDHFPVDRLPDELLHGLPADATVRITVEDDTAVRTKRPLSDYLGKAQKVHDDPVSDIRALRDEWE